MILTADSGSTKTKWMYGNHSELNTYVGLGMNPVYESEENILASLRKTLPENCRPEKVYFYGAGCVGAYAEKMQKVLQQQFPNTEIICQSDLNGAAIALYGNGEGLACILGTGSNSGYYKNQNIEQNIRSLGLYMGDEGSGGYIGKQFMKRFLRQQFSADLLKKLESEFNNNYSEIIHKIYNEPYPNRYLASLVPTIKKFDQEPEVQQLIKECFRDLFINVLLKYKIARKSIGFVGSIAFHFQNELRQCAQEFDYTISALLPSPIEAITNYHLNQLRHE